MSELTSYNSERIYWAVEQVEREAGDIDDLHLDDNLFYLKSEADKVIADLEESHKKEVEQLLIEIVELKADYKEACDRLHTANLIKDEQLSATRHQKYKRCLAMARWCAQQRALIDFPEIDIFQYLQWRFLYFGRWHKRWLKLAEKFKPNKEAK